MRKPLSLLLAAALVFAVAVWWWPYEGVAMSVVPGWHTMILAPHAVAGVLASAVLLGVALVIVIRQLGGRKASR